MLIFDGDYPMAFGALDLNRDLTRPLQEVRNPSDPPKMAAWNDGETMASLPEMRRGGVAAALVKIVGRIRQPNSPIWGYSSGDNAYAAARGHLAYYEILAQRGQVRLLATSAALDAHIAAWETETDRADLPVGLVLGMEGADPILWPEQVHEWWTAGLRVVSLAHYGVSAYAHGTGRPGGLLPPAAALLAEMDKAGMILDLTHTSDEAFWQALDLFGGPLLASHQNCRALVPGERQFSDAQLKAILARGAVVGASMDTWMLYDSGIDWGDDIPPRRDHFPRDAVTLADLADHIDHVCQLDGNTDQAAIGGDTDGQGGRDGAPLEIDTVADYRRLANILADRNYGDDAIAGVMYRNWQRFYSKWLPAA